MKRGVDESKYFSCLCHRLPARYDFGLPNPWLNCPGLPAGAAAVLAALHLAEPRPEALARLNDGERVAALDFCHHAGLTLLVRDVLPAATARDAANNLLRLRVLEETYRWLAGLPVDFVALKGITQCALFGIRPEDRAQSDIDLYCPRETVEAARDALMAAGYLPIAGLEAFPTDHLPAMMRPTTWQWRGDFFDPEMPLAIELHFQFWNPRLERLPAEGVDAFWTRRVRRTVGGADLAVLSPVDAVAYAALHLLKHVLHGDTRRSTYTRSRASCTGTRTTRRSGRSGAGCTPTLCGGWRRLASCWPRRGSAAGWHGGAEESGATARRHADVVRGVRHVAGRAAFSRQQG